LDLRVNHEARRATGLLMLLIFSTVFASQCVSVAPQASADPLAIQPYLLQLTNEARVKAGRPALQVSAGLRHIARGWSAAMARRDELAHNPRRVQQVERRVTTRWVHLAENVGYAIDSDASARELAGRIFALLMDSPGHRANILGEFDRTGIGIRVTHAGKLWVTQVFMKRG
jgi:uncharacterized protein YkwD